MHSISSIMLSIDVLNVYRTDYTFIYNTKLKVIYQYVKMLNFSTLTRELFSVNTHVTIFSKIYSL